MSPKLSLVSLGVQFFKKGSKRNLIVARAYCIRTLFFRNTCFCFNKSLLCFVSLGRFYQSCFEFVIAQRSSVFTQHTYHWEAPVRPFCTVRENPAACWATYDVHHAFLTNGAQILVSKYWYKHVRTGIVEIVATKSKYWFGLRQHGRIWRFWDSCH